MFKIVIYPVRGVLSPFRRVEPMSMGSEFGTAMLNAADAEIAGSRFFEKQWHANQSAWRPLDPGYVEEKVAAGLSPLKWSLSGDTLRGLTTPVMVNSSNRYGRTSRLVFNAGYAAECVWLLGYPMASGWPGDKHPESFFRQNQRIRPWLFELDSATRKRVEDKMAGAIDFFWESMMARYFYR